MKSMLIALGVIYLSLLLVPLCTLLYLMKTKDWNIIKNFYKDWFKK